MKHSLLKAWLFSFYNNPYISVSQLFQTNNRKNNSKVYGYQDYESKKTFMHPNYLLHKNVKEPAIIFNEIFDREFDATAYYSRDNVNMVFRLLPSTNNFHALIQIVKRL